MSVSETVVTRRFSQEDIYDYAEFLEKSKAYFEEAWRDQDIASVPIEDFQKIRTLGIGACGRVMMVRNMKNGQHYAAKVLDKAKILQTHQLAHTLNEKRILQALNFPFVVHLEFFAQDNSYLYFIMPMVSGGEMWSHLRRLGRFEEDLAKFYGGQVLLAIEYLHNLDLVHRDLKPENILIDRTGYIKVADFGFCKMVTGRTWTSCGTAEYMAPEIIRSMGYGKSVDWWSFGVLLFEMASGQPPFVDPSPMQIHEKASEGKYRMPGFFSPDLKDLVRNLLQADLTKRYGNLKNGAEDVKRQKWFHSTNWLSLVNRKIDPPYVPKTRGPADTTNFDLYEETPLRVSSTDRFCKEFQDF